MNETTHSSESTPHRLRSPIAIRDFLAWGYGMLGWRVAGTGDGGMELQPPASSEEESTEPAPIHLSPEGPAGEGGWTLESAPVRELVGRLRETGANLTEQPADEPRGVHELTPNLFRPYQVDEGQVHLAGCSMEERPFLRVLWRGTDSAGLSEAFYDPEGVPVKKDLVESLGMRELVRRPTRVSREAAKGWSEWLQRAASREGRPVEQQVAATSVWCKYATGKLTLNVGASSAEVAFQGWARHFATGRLKPPPYTCPRSHLSSFHVEALEDGRLTVHEAVAVCEITGCRMLAQELERCEATGKLAQPVYLTTCPVSGQRVLSEALRPCPQCRQQVSPACLEPPHTICDACRSMQPARPEDPQLARVLDQYPGLDGRRRWWLAETGDRILVRARSWWKQVLLVLDKETLEIRHAATAGRFSREWEELAEQDRKRLERPG